MVHEQTQELPDLTRQEIALRTEIKEETDLPIIEIKDHSDLTDHRQNIEEIQEITDQTEDRIPPTEEKVEARMQ